MSYGVLKDDGNPQPTTITAPPKVPVAPNMEAQTPQSRPAALKKPFHAPSQSKSMPSTPFHRPHSRSDSRASPSPEPQTKNGSPLSLPSDKSYTPPAGRRQYGGCKYETGMQRARRRVPYSLGPDPLDKIKSDQKTTLIAEEDEQLTQDMHRLYDALQPTAESEGRRSSFIAKLESILHDRWPGSSTKVNVFGSTGNNLGTSDSDVDICITTDCKEMERVCNIAELLASNGMERVVCVSSAKVPIVKVWDPELQVACDINVNNPLALENTDMMRTYVNIDPRVRPLAMIIKHWAKRRMMNDAALGGTLSSYTWICLALNFLQTRDPPILPTLQQQPNLQPKEVAGVNVTFDGNIEHYKDFGARNKSSLGSLLFQFFRHYGHEFDFEQNIVSVRLGRYISKSEKGWQLLQDNRLCVEEPFNISRNLANTADDTSMRGIHLELRRAFDLVANVKLDKCCEQFVHAPEEIKSSELFIPPSSRPIVAQFPPSTARGNRNSARGARSSSSLGRPPNTRRSSNPSGRGINGVSGVNGVNGVTPYLRNPPFQMTTHELQLQQQHQQHLLHDHLIQQYQYLQNQERELRLQLYQQSLQQQRELIATYGQQAASSHYSSQDKGADAVNGMPNAASRAPLSAPLHQHGFPRSPFFTASQLGQGIITNPSSPRMGSTMPDARRFSRRTSLTQAAAGGSLRAHSQPARPALTALGPMYRPDVSHLQESNYGRRSSASSNSQGEHAGSTNGYPYFDPHRRPAEYLGYYVGQSPSLSAYTHSTAISPIPSHVGLNIQNGGLSPRLTSTTHSSNKVHTPPMATVKPAKPMDLSASQARSPPRKQDAVTSGLTSPKPRSGPLIVDGSITSPRRPRPNPVLNDLEDVANFSASTSEDLTFDTPSSSDEQSQADYGGRGRGSPLSSVTTHVPTDELPTHINGQVQSSSMESHAHSSVAGSSAAVGSLAAIKRAMGPAWPLDRQLSAVEEVRTPSPRVDTFDPIFSSPKPGKGRSGQAEAAGDAAATSLNATGSPQPKALTPRPNGLPGSPVTLDALIPNNSNGWIVQKKKKQTKRKTVKSENDAQSPNPLGGESLPTDESLRKGG